MGFYVTDQDPHGFVLHNSTNPWLHWVLRQIPATINEDIRDNLASNLKHIIVGLELKASLLRAHLEREPGSNSRLFESYAQIMNFEFCVGTYSILEGLGSVIWFDQNENDGTNPGKFGRNDWRSSLAATYDSDNEGDLVNLVRTVESVRDKLHQDKLVSRIQIDWHAFDSDRSFIPAIRALRIILARSPQGLPEHSPLFE
ncbi:hypothetical protein CN884_12000 [Ochrobactrum sp. 30A/1000/2015]|nr:hypothetical protein CN884_12000 [Ochrobactrum sp. 30A/1000/2015]PJT37553.1 hypothetical protein CN883_16415 [Ochrobactrum sp. 27A/999/2015]PJT44209.1 hypothetical protein CN882_09975 [Ochrobactrum sp. 23A/997/2015]